MKNTFKLSIAALAAFAVCLLATVAQAQSYSPVTLTTGASIVPSAATNVNSVLFVGKMDNVALQITGGLSNAVSTVVSLAFVRSVDGSSYTSEVTPANTIVVSLGSAAGAFPTVITNLPTTLTHGIGYIKLSYITNAAAAGGHPTNFVIRAGSKVGT